MLYRKILSVVALPAISASLLLSSFSANACIVTKEHKGGFLPENNLNIAVGDKNANDMTEEKFNQIIDKVEKVFKPIVAKKGGILRVARKWDDGTVNASAQQFFKVWQVNMYGGLARHNLTTDDGFALVVCHELGHHLGGAPKVGNSSMKWASNEGQSDYYGNMKCFRRVFAEDDNVKIMEGREVDSVAKEKCDEVYKEQKEAALCYRAAMAGKSLAQLLASLGGRGTVNFATPDSSVVSRTNDAHPQAQCRLDTYFQGALCDRPVSDDVSNSDANKGVCNQDSGDSVGLRPLCWYKP